MPPTIYKLNTWGPLVGNGATAPNLVAVAGVAKRAQPPGAPYIVANEVVCGTLGRVLGLPVPPGFVVKHDDTPCHVSLDFHLAGDSLPPADPDALCAAHPSLAAGIALFDVWIVNDDRHNRNLAFFSATKQVNVFDHSHAFLGAGDNGRARLGACRDQLGIGPPGQHCLACRLTTADHFPWWLERIQAVPRYVIEDAVREASHVGLPPADVDFCIEFLDERRGRLLGLVKATRDRFPNIQETFWDSDAAPDADADGSDNDEP